MSELNQQEAQLTDLSDDYIRELEPESQRYDITLAQDFVISVLPNGIKTWAFIYDFQGRNRRKTLGVFPEMNFQEAKTALEKARASMLRMDEPTVAPNEFGQLPAVLGGSHYSSKREKKPFNYGIWIKFLGGLVVIALIAFAAMKGVEWRNQQVSEQDSAQDNPSLPFAISKKPDTQTQPVTSAPSKPEPKPKLESQPETTNNQTSQSPTPTPAAKARGRSTQAPTAQPPAPTRTSRQTTATPATSTRPTTTASPTPARTGGNTQPVTTLTTTTKATAFGGRVSRSTLTSRVQNTEPTDTLGPEISYKNSGFTRIFYYTELRQFGDGDVVHRWSLNGEVQEEVVLKVKRSWRWRTWSNKDITPGLNGEWKVETIDATGKILDSLVFTYDYQ